MAAFVSSRRGLKYWSRRERQYSGTNSLLLLLLSLSLSLLDIPKDPVSHKFDEQMSLRLSETRGEKMDWKTVVVVYNLD